MHDLKHQRSVHTMLLMIILIIPVTTFNHPKSRLTVQMKMKKEINCLECPTLLTVWSELEEHLNWLWHANDNFHMSV